MPLDTVTRLNGSQPRMPRTKHHIPPHKTSHASMHAYTHARTPTRMHTGMHACMHVCMRACMHESMIYTIALFLPNPCSALRPQSIVSQSLDKDYMQGLPWLAQRSLAAAARTKVSCTASRALQALHCLQSSATMQALHCLQHDCAAYREHCIAYSALPTLHCLQHDCTAYREPLHCLHRSHSFALSQTHRQPTA